jgi:hypothetical protein
MSKCKAGFKSFIRIGANDGLKYVNDNRADLSYDMFVIIKNQLLSYLKLKSLSVGLKSLSVG